MSYINKFNAVRQFCLLWVFIALSINLMAQQKTKNETPSSGITLTITAEDGKILPGVQIVVGEGEKYILTNNLGVASFDANEKDDVKITYPGYEEKVILAETIVGQSAIRLKKSNLFATSDDIVPLPFIDLKKRNITGSSIVLSGSQLEKYQGTDIRNAFTGLANGLEVREINGSPGVNVVENYTTGAEKVDLQLRGRSPMYMIDGMPTDLTEMPLDPSEIETVTLIKDVVAKAMFGPAGADGILYIRTKRGKLNERNINVNVEKGVSIIDRMPSWANGADYARLNNLARANSGILPVYSDDAISKYAVNDGYDRYRPANNFRDMMFKNTMSYNRANVSSSGGNDMVRYFSYLGYSGEGDLYKIGSTSNYNRIITRSNIDIRINEFLKVKFGIYGALSLRSSPNYGDGTELTQFNSAITDANTTPPVAFPVYANNNPALEKPWYAVTSSYPENPIGALVGKGFYNEMGRSGATNIAFDYDMSHLIKGLSSETYVAFNIFNQVRKGKAENYSAYIVKPALTTAGMDTILLSKVHDGLDQADLSKLTDYYYQRFAVYESLKHEANFGGTNLQNTLTYFSTKVARDGYEDAQRQQNIVWSGIVNHKDKYSVQAVVNYAGTYSFAKDNRFQVFPSIGAGWVISEEKFMKSLQFIDYLKLRAEAGILGYDNFQAPFYYRDNYTTSTSGSSFGPYTTNTWFGTSSDNSVARTTHSRTGNPDLSWEKRKEFNVGLDASLFGGKLNLELNYYNNLRDGIISQITSIIPSVVGLNAVLPKLNYNKIRYFGLETSLRYADHAGDFRYSIGGNATIQNTQNVKIDEPDYINEYQSKLGQPIDSYYGLRYLGKFQSDAEALLVPQLFDAVLHAGDLKYQDENKDGFIDDNDKISLGHTTPRLYYAIHLNLKFKSFELSVIGTGRAFYDIPLTNSYYWNGWGENNYSAFVRDNIGGSYPRLTYNKVNNNFTGSDFWLVKGGFFKLQNVELAYNVPPRLLHQLGMRGICVFVKGTNLYTISKIKDVDPESISSGVTSYPLLSNFTTGFKLTF